MSVTDTINTLKSELLPKLVDEGRFGTDKTKFLDFTVGEGATQIHFQSEVIFGDVVMETENNGKCVQSVVIKVQPFTDIPPFINLGLSYYNEFYFYNDIIPFLRKYDSTGIIDKYFPKFFYGKATQGTAPRDDILIFENLQKLGFKAPPSKSFLSYDHIKLTLSSIAEFHSLSIVCKNRDPEGFRELTSKIVESAWTEDIFQAIGPLFSEGCKRGVLPLQNEPGYEDKLSDIFAIIDNMGPSLMKKLFIPEEPVSVICHGDFCTNNIFYKYDADDKPVGTKFYDFGFTRHATPAIDLTYFLFMNYSPDRMSKNWDDILTTYHTALKSNPDLVDGDVCPTLEEIRLDVQRRGFFGYGRCSSFLPLILDDGDKLPDEKEWANLIVNKKDEIFNVYLGGDKATHYIALVVKHMIDQNFDFKYVLNL